MARNLRRRVSTDEFATPVPVDHPEKPKSGDLCRVNSMCGIALINEQFGFGANEYRQTKYSNPPMDPNTFEAVPDGFTPVVFSPHEWWIPAYNSGDREATYGEPIYYTDTAMGPAGDVNYHAVMTAKNGAPSGADLDNRTAFAGYLMTSLAAGTAGRVGILIWPTPFIQFKTDKLDQEDADR